MRYYFEAVTAVKVNGEVQPAGDRFSAEYDEVVEALVVNRLIEPVLVEVEPREVPVWEVEHLEA